VSSESIDIVAEAAEGYASDWGKELALVDLAAAAGATALKLQLLYPEELLAPDHPLHDLVASLEMEPGRWAAVADRCRERGIELFLDVFGTRGLELAIEVGAHAVKAHSSDMVNEDLLAQLGQAPVRRVLLSAGGTTMKELDRAMELIGAPERVTVIHGFQAYPTPIGDNRLTRLSALAQRFPLARIGFADHTGFDDPAGEWLPALALALGARYVEKHITVAHVLEDPDHQSALAPDAFARFVANLRSAEAALGDPGADPDASSEAEGAYRLKMKKHVVAARALAAGTTVDAQDLALRRCHEPPEDVLFAASEATGRTLSVALAEGEPLRRSSLA
jgi:N,N'-diacetyllegionaminate synthase